MYLRTIKKYEDIVVTIATALVSAACQGAISVSAARTSHSPNSHNPQRHYRATRLARCAFRLSDSIPSTHKINLHKGISVSKRNSFCWLLVLVSLRALFLLFHLSPHLGNAFFRFAFAIPINTPYQHLTNSVSSKLPGPSLRTFRPVSCEVSVWNSFESFCSQISTSMTAVTSQCLVSKLFKLKRPLGRNVVSGVRNSTSWP